MTRHCPRCLYDTVPLADGSCGFCGSATIMDGKRSVRRALEVVLLATVAMGHSEREQVVR